MKTTCFSSSPAETEALGERLAERCEGVSVIALFGDLGAGKTAFVRGLARGLGCRLAATSPTFSIVNEYPGRRDLCHFDMYRLTGPDDLYEIGWEDYLSSGALCAVEWSERVSEAFPCDTVEVHIEKLSDTERRFTFVGLEGEI